MLSERSNKHIEKSFFKFFEADEDLGNNDYTVEEQYAIQTLKVILTLFGVGGFLNRFRSGGGVKYDPKPNRQFLS